MSNPTSTIRQGTASPLRLRIARKIQNSLKTSHPGMELPLDAADAIIAELGLSAQYSIMYPAISPNTEMIESRNLAHDDTWGDAELTEQDLDEPGDVLATRVVSKGWILQEKL